MYKYDNILLHATIYSNEESNHEVEVDSNSESPGAAAHTYNSMHA